jgi:hypothetical protein
LQTYGTSYTEQEVIRSAVITMAGTEDWERVSQLRFRQKARAKRGDQLPGLEGFDAASGLAEPTPECRRIMNGWLGDCVFGKAEKKSFLQVSSQRKDLPGLDGYDTAAGLAEPTGDCKKVMNGWMSKCVFAKAADATQPQ